MRNLNSRVKGALFYYTNCGYKQNRQSLNFVSAEISNQSFYLKSTHFFSKLCTKSFADRQKSTGGRYYSFIFDIPQAGQRAVAGIVFVDTDGDKRFNSRIDLPVEGASITAGGRVAVSDADGEYILRNLPAGDIHLIVRSPRGIESSTVTLSLGVQPTIQRAINLMSQR